jgi:hypothetical protein
MAGNTAEIRVGRLLEVRIDAGYRTIEEVESLFLMLASAVRKLSAGAKHVTVVDWRLCPIMSPDCAAFVVQQMVAVNAKTERSATIASADAPISVIQFTRLIRESNSPVRQLFYDEPSLLGWLAEVLTPKELKRARLFLARS